VTFDNLIGYLVVAASTTLGGFIVFCFVDVIAGAGLAFRTGTFDPNKLPSFLAAQFATKELLGVLGLGVTAGTTAFASTIVQGGLTEAALQTVAQVALAAMTAGAATMIVSVLSDALSKVSELFSAAPAAPATPPAVLPS